MEIYEKCLTLLLLVIESGLTSSLEHDINTTEFVTCACDMTVGLCDVSCCCDKDCSEVQLQSFLCSHSKEEHLHGISGDWNCHTPSSYSPPYVSHFLCIEHENSPFIGYFFANVPIVKDLPSLNDLIRTHKSRQNEQKPNSQQPHKIVPTVNSINDKGYVFGQDLLVVSKSFQSEKLFVPHSMYNSMCDSLNPVLYLHDLHSTCLMNVSKSCGSPLLNVQSFVIGHDKKIFGSPGDEIPLKNVSVKYFYMTEPCCYLRSKINAKCRCDNNLLVLSYGTLLPSYVEQKTCYNSVMNVSYLFFWKGGRILSVDMYVVLGNISVSGDSVLSQRFSVSFEYLKNETQVDVSTNTTKVKKVTSVGYEFGSTLIGHVHNDSLFDSEEPIEERSLRKVPLFMWESDASAFCVISHLPVLFGKDILSGCLFKVSDWDNINCQELRKDVESHLSEVLKADFLSRGGNLGGIDLILVNKSELAEINETDVHIPAMSGCTRVPHHVHLEVTYAEVAKVHGNSIYKILNAALKYSTTTWIAPTERSDVSFHPVYSSVQFTYLPVKNAKRIQRTKRFWLPTLILEQCSEETCWEDILYPLTSQFEVGERLFQALDTVFLVTILAASAYFLLKMRTCTSTKI